MTILGLTPFWTAALAAFLGIVATARIARLIVSDSFPLSIYLRVWWDNHTSESLWNPLLHCPWCITFWIVLANAGVAWATHLHPVWFILNGLLAASYAASWIVFHDED